MQAYVVAIIAAVPPTLAIILTRWRSRKQIQEVHVLVNDRAEKQDAKIDRLEAQLREAKEDAP